MSLLEAHLEQISICSSTISELPFPPPKIFTNAILRTDDITALIRDTEAHERALYSVDPSPELMSGRGFEEPSTRRSTIFNTKTGGPNGLKAYQLPRRTRLVNAVLGGDLARQLQAQSGSRAKTSVDVDLLLEGAEKLCGIYPITGAMERIAALRQRHTAITTSISKYEALVAEQTTQLGRLRVRSFSTHEDDDLDLGTSRQAVPEDLPYTPDDMRREEEGIRELERKKRALELRVSGMEKDLGGLMR